MAKAVKVGDTGTGHDGFPATAVTLGSPNVNIDNSPAARVGDSLEAHDKPNHPPHERIIASGSSTVFINGKPAAMSGGAISCGGVTIGSASVNIGDITPTSSKSKVPIKTNMNKAITSLFFSYGDDRVMFSDVSRHYTDIHLHAQTTGYLQGESITIQLGGAVNKTVTGFVDSDGMIFIGDVLKTENLEFEGII